MLTLALPVQRAGKYAIALCGTVSDISSFQVCVDGVPLGEVVDGYRMSRPLFFTRALGTRELSAGEHTLSLRLLGSFDGATDGHAVKLDYVKLTPIH